MARGDGKSKFMRGLNLDKETKDTIREYQKLKVKIIKEIKK